MSHLQPKFIAKAKASMNRSRAPRAMPRSMILEAASSSVSATRPRKNNPETGWFWCCWPNPDYRVFTLKK
jgi:hypothetical protein